MMDGDDEKQIMDTVQWLIAETPDSGSPARLLERYCHKLREAGIKVDRSTLGAPLLHPIAQSSYVFWDIEKGPSQRWFQWTPDALDTMRASPIFPIYDSGTPSSMRLDRPEERSRFPIGDDLWADGYYQYEALPLRFSDGSFKALTLATRNPEGFSEEDWLMINATLPALALVFEGFVARNTATTLMETYVGKRAGLRVLDGQIARGDGAHIDAVICFSDLRGFTTLAQRHDENSVLELLNDYFGQMTDAVERNSGEVLKFIGDAMLAIFPHEDDLAGAIDNAETAAIEVLSNQEKSAGYEFGIGLHPGKVFYGNIGGGTRLDFTVIGDAVNVTSRIEGLCAELDEKLLASSDLATQSKRQWKLAGERNLKGVSDPIAIYTPGFLN